MIDHYLPVEMGTGRLKLSYSDDNELWINFLEKAYAKSHGSFEVIEGGFGIESFVALTGAPTKLIRPQEIDDKDGLAKSLVTEAANGAFMVAGTPGKPTGDPRQNEYYDKNGLVYGHMYTLMNVVKVEENGRPVILFKLRNPHARDEWRLKWADDSQSWTPELKKLLGVER